MAFNKCELVHECHPRYLNMGIPRMKEDDTEEEGKKMMAMKSTTGTKFRNPNGLTIVRAYCPLGLLLPKLV